MTKEIEHPATFDEVFLWIRNNKQLEELDRISGVTQLLATIDCIDTLRWIAASGLVGLELLDSIEINYPNHLLHIKVALAKLARYEKGINRINEKKEPIKEKWANANIYLLEELTKSKTLTAAREEAAKRAGIVVGVRHLTKMMPDPRKKT